MKRRKIGPTSLGTEVIESAILPDSRYEDDWLSHRFSHNLKSNSNGVSYRTTPFAGVHGSLLCPRLHPTTHFTISRKFATKNRGRNIFFALNDFSLLFLFMSLTRRGFRIQQFLRKWRKMGATSIFWLLFLFFSLTRRALLNSTNSVKFAKNRGRNHLSHFTIFCHFFVLTYQRGLLNSFNSP